MTTLCITTLLVMPLSITIVNVKMHNYNNTWQNSTQHSDTLRITTLLVMTLSITIVNVKIHSMMPCLTTCCRMILSTTTLNIAKFCMMIFSITIVSFKMHSMMPLSSTTLSRRILRVMTLSILCNDI
jgi:hypothetical protein